MPRPRQYRPCSCPRNQFRKTLATGRWTTHWRCDGCRAADPGWRLRTHRPMAAGRPPQCGPGPLPGAHATARRPVPDCLLVPRLPAGTARRCQNVATTGHRAIPGRALDPPATSRPASRVPAALPRRESCAHSLPARRRPDTARRTERGASWCSHQRSVAPPAPGAAGLGRSATAGAGPTSNCSPASRPDSTCACC